MKFLPCSCQVCTGTTVRGLLELDHAERTRLLAIHNLSVLREEVEACKEAIAEGRLWDLVEERSMAHPRLRDAFHELARNSAVLRDGTPAIKERGLFLRSVEDLSRPELGIARARAKRAVRTGSRQAVLVPKERRTPRSVRGNPDVYRFHPALGSFPAELDSAYPFGQVTMATELQGEASVEDSIKELRNAGYSRISFSKGRSSTRSKRSRQGASPSPP
jgi:7-cyano-7-deazaguanine tRNA-ribosyltransferase